MPIEVRINGLGSNLCILSAEPTWLFRDLKSAVENAIGLHAACFKLVKGTTELRSAKFLLDIPPGSSVDLTLIRRQFADKETLLEAVRLNRSELQTASPELKADRDVVLAALARSYHAFQYAAPELRALSTESSKRRRIMS